jgi:hypothetical protein
VFKVVFFYARTLILALWFAGPALLTRLTPSQVNMLLVRRLGLAELVLLAARLVLAAEAGLK